MNELIELFRKIFLFKIVNTEKVTISVLTVVTVILAFILTNILLRFVRKTISKRLPVQDRNKFVSIFQVLKYGVYIIVVIFTLNASGVNMNVFLTASAALFVGLGFAATATLSRYYFWDTTYFRSIHACRRYSGGKWYCGKS